MSQPRLIMILLLILQADATAFLIALGFQNTVSENTFAFFLAIDLIGFAMTSYLYRTLRSKDLPSRGWIVTGCCVILGIFFSSLILR